MTRSDDSPVPDYAGRLSLKDRGFIVIGAGNGMGRQAAHALASLGARTICVDQDPGLAEDIAKEVSGIGVALDMTKRENVQTVVDRAVQEFGQVDGLVDIIGLARWMDLIDLDDDTWNFEFDVCLRHAFLAMQIGARAMRQSGGGAMAFVASISGLFSAPNHAAYGAAKAGLMSLVRTAAVEFGKYNIRVNAVAPGATATPRIKGLLTPETQAKHEDLIPTGRLNEPSDIASALLFMVSDLSANITGQTLVVDGGVTSRYAFQ
ncbi:MAG: short-chain dehydrogenase/reductase [Pseudonocardiales bacterium]|nr:short-chain dehydrogenase/reductase [Pseudonocardiales bacterium]